MSHRDLVHKYRMYRFNSVAISEILVYILNFVEEGFTAAK